MVDRIGEQLGNYRLIRLLGEGGFAEVYLGEHIYIGTEAAIKVLHTQLASDDMEHFRTEARTIARLEHPHIVRILDFGVQDKTPFLVMSYAPNGSLRQKHPKGNVVPLPTVVSYVKQIADALQFAHNEKLIHRDIKPENMLVGRRNEVLLSDFGIAVVAQSSRYQSTQNMAGTMAYMAPEQIQGKPRPASDQYSLGIVVYEWLCGERPFHGSLSEMIGQHLSVSPLPLSEKVPTISLDVEQVVLTALAKNTKERFASVQDFAVALEQVYQQLRHPSISAPSHQPSVITNLKVSSSQAFSLPSLISAPGSDAKLPSLPSFPLSRTIKSRWSLSTRKTVLLLGVVFMIVLGIIGLLSPAIVNVIATLTPHIHLTPILSVTPHPLITPSPHPTSATTVTPSPTVVPLPSPDAGFVFCQTCTPNNLEVEYPDTWQQGTTSDTTGVIFTNPSAQDQYAAFKTPGATTKNASDLVNVDLQTNFASKPRYTSPSNSSFTTIASITWAYAIAHYQSPSNVQELIEVFATVHQGEAYIIELQAPESQFNTVNSQYFEKMLSNFHFLA